MWKTPTGCFYPCRYYIASEGRCRFKWRSCLRAQVNIIRWDEWTDYAILKAVSCKQNHRVNPGVHVPRCNLSAVNNEICWKLNVCNWNQRRNYTRKRIKRKYNNWKGKKGKQPRRRNEMWKILATIKRGNYYTLGQRW